MKSGVFEAPAQARMGHVPSRAASAAPTERRPPTGGFFRARRQHGGSGRRTLLGLALSFLVAGHPGHAQPFPLNPPGPALPGTQLLTLPGDLASNLVAGVDRFLNRKLSESPAGRVRHWASAGASGAAVEALIATNRGRLAEILGAVESRPAPEAFEWVQSVRSPALVATSATVRIQKVRWRAFGEVHGEGLLLTPAGREPVADVVAVPDVEVTPEQLAGLVPGVAPESQYARRLAESGCRVAIPFLIDRRKGEPKVDWDPQRGRNLSNREFLHRAAFEMGRTLAGYEVVKVLAAVDRLRFEAPERPVGVLGWGEGGRLALYAAALDPRIGATCVSGYYGPRERVWEEPLDRNVFGLLDRFGDAEIAALVAPRALVVEAAKGPEAEFASDGGAPGVLRTASREEVRMEVGKAIELLRSRSANGRIELVESGDGRGPGGTAEALGAFLRALSPGATLAAGGGSWAHASTALHDATLAARAARQRAEIDRHTQALLTDSAAVRARYMAGLDTSSPEKFAASQARYRELFDTEVMGRFEEPLAGFEARTRLAYDEPAWRGFEVVLDVYPEVVAYGLLLLPKDLREGERRPVVVCQHGLEGRPQHTIGKEGFEAYSAFSARLAERGFVVFAPQNLYLFRDRFRVLQRKANPLGKTLFSVIVPQHRQIVNWLKQQPFVDPQRIGFYGLSYGGKTAMRVPALVTDYCLSICSADFNEWVWKNTSTRTPYSYVWTGEYEIFEWNLGHTFNYAEMAALIAPRPFMVERGHFDGVAPDETVGYEFAKVRHLYAARLKLPPDDCRIEWFVGPHKINGVGTYEFLHRHLGWRADGGK